MARPIPWAAAVTRTTLPFSLSLILASRVLECLRFYRQA
jgi:hypothetical protein